MSGGEFPGTRIDISEAVLDRIGRTINKEWATGDGRLKRVLIIGQIVSIFSGIYRLKYGMWELGAYNEDTIALKWKFC